MIVVATLPAASFSPIKRMQRYEVHVFTFLDVLLHIAFRQQRNRT